MSLSSALHAAVSGLGVTSRRAETVSNNIANAQTEGYARRSLVITTTALSPGVRTVGIHRDVDAPLLREQRAASREAAGTDLLARQMVRIEQAFGRPGDEAGIAQAISRMETSLITAAGDPDSPARLADVANATQDLARQFARVSATLQSVRADADRLIATDIGTVNDALSRMERLDRQILSFRAGGRDASSLLDQRQAAVDSIADIIPVREVERPGGLAALVTLSGLVLFDGRAADVAFTPTATITAGSGPLPQVTVNGRALASDGDGRLSTALRLRDSIAPSLQQDLDGLATHLATRLAAADVTLSPGAAGLLAERGAFGTPGLAGRLQLNPLADPATGGALWRMRAGLGAASDGPAGDGKLLRALSSALTEGADTPALRAGAMLDGLGLRRVDAQRDAAQAAARAAVLDEQRAAGGVNTDSELQDLMQVEKAFAANARVLQAVDEMLTFLLSR